MVGKKDKENKKKKEEGDKLQLMRNTNPHQQNVCHQGMGCCYLTKCLGRQDFKIIKANMSAFGPHLSSSRF